MSAYADMSITELKADILAKAKKNGVYRIPQGFDWFVVTKLGRAFKELVKEKRLRADGFDPNGHQRWIPA